MEIESCAGAPVGFAMSSAAAMEQISSRRLAAEPPRGPFGPDQR
jgi:hypothetical protein